MNWDKIIKGVGVNYLRDFVNSNYSLESLYRRAVQFNVGPEVRPLVREYHAKRARRAAREALRRRGLLNYTHSVV